MYHLAQTFLKENGYKQYEISNWAKPGKECQHNIVYWKCEPYLGLGLGAHSLYRGRRYYNEEDIKCYIDCQGDLSKIRHEEEQITDKIAMEEYVFLGLRLLEGIDEKDFEKRFGQTIWTVYKEPLQKWIRLGLLIYKDNRIYLSTYGLDVCNEVFSSFL